MQGSLTYKVGDATQPSGDGKKMIVHCCNDVGAWGAGFVLALSARWPVVEAEYRRKGKWQRWSLGEVQTVSVEDDITVANLIGQHDVRHLFGRSPVRYDAIYDGLVFLSSYAGLDGHSIHMPRMGAGLAGGKWSIIEAIINETLVASGFDVTVYDLP
jgi:O-acetyl-ADP-ribose deacetylase (regulator of RNase III)